MASQTSHRTDTETKSDLRTFLDELAEHDQLYHVTTEVDPRKNVGTLADQSDKALLFDNLAGYPDWRLCAELCYRRESIALGLGVDVDDIAKHYSKITGQESYGDGETVLIDPEAAPVKENVDTDPDLNDLPIAIHSEGDGELTSDSGETVPFIGSGMGVTRNPETGTLNSGILRHQLFEPQEMGVLMLPQDSESNYDKWTKRGEDMPFALAIGHHPVLDMISSYNGPSEMNEFELSAGVMGETLEMVECETVDLEVPARAEVVIEGHINKDVRRDEGPFGEFYGYNESGSGQHPVFEVSTVTHRDDPIFRHIQATRFTEHQKLGALMREGETYRIVGEAVNDLHDVAYPAWGTLFTGIIQLTPRYNGETRRALMAALSGGKPIPPNIVIAVDDDVDITSEEDILWSISTRCNPEEDVFVVDDTLGHPMQPALVERLSASAGGDWHRTGGMMGIDATKPPTVNEAKRDEFEVVSPMGEGSIRLEDVLDED